ncbi:MAG: hypothetical protein J0H75_02845, partial [Rhizobiales bacterium]|nr:hypothetical protein [Hyphomicrobiales bacterium]
MTVSPAEAGSTSHAARSRALPPGEMPLEKTPLESYVPPAVPSLVGLSRLELADLLTSVNVEPVALHFFGPDPDDLSYLRGAEDDKAFCPPHTALILNEGLIKDGRPRETAFREVRDHPVYKEAVRRGCVEVWFPKLGCMPEVNAGNLSFTDAEHTAALGLTNRQRVAV